MSPSLIALQIRGRGPWLVRPDGLVLASKGGRAVPERSAVGELQPGDYVGIPYGGIWTNSAAQLPVLPVRRLYGTEKDITVPGRMTTELAFLLGAYLAEGHTNRNNWSVVITNSVEAVLVRAQRAWASEFCLSSRITKAPGRCMGLVVSGKRLVEYMELLACGSRASNKSVPRVIAEGTRGHALAFLQGVALDAYVTHTGAAKWAICLESEVAIRGLQELVTRLGIVNAQIPKYNRTYDKTYFELYAAGAQGQALSRLVPFMEPDKRQRAEAYLAETYGPGAADAIPGLDGPSLYAMVPPGRCGPNGRGTGRQVFRHLCDPRTTRVTRASIVRAADRGAELPDWLQSIIEKNIHFSPVVAVEHDSGRGGAMHGQSL